MMYRAGFCAPANNDIICESENVCGLECEEPFVLMCSGLRMKGYWVWRDEVKPLPDTSPWRGSIQRTNFFCTYAFRPCIHWGVFQQFGLSRWNVCPSWPFLHVCMYWVVWLQLSQKLPHTACYVDSLSHVNFFTCHSAT